MEADGGEVSGGEMDEGVTVAWLKRTMSWQSEL